MFIIKYDSKISCVTFELSRSMLNEYLRKFRKFADNDTPYTLELMWGSEFDEKSDINSVFFANIKSFDCYNQLLSVNNSIIIQSYFIEYDEKENSIFIVGVKNGWKEISQEISKLFENNVLTNEFIISEEKILKNDVVKKVIFKIVEID